MTIKWVVAAVAAASLSIATICFSGEKMRLLRRMVGSVLRSALAGCFLVLLWAPVASAVSADDGLVGVSSVTAQQLEAELRSRNPNHIHADIAQLYVDWGRRFGLRADFAFAQMLHETNFLRYGGDVSPAQNNFAGIGATGGGNPGNSFTTPELGVIAHYAHLAWYAYPDHVNQYCNSAYDPRHFGGSHANTAHTPRELGGRWAVPGTTYGDSIARLTTETWRYAPDGGYIGSANLAHEQDPPAAALPAPTGGDKVSGRVIVSAIAWDFMAVSKVELYVDGQLKKTQTIPPYTATWDTASFTNGSQHELAAVAYNPSGRTARASKTVAVDNFTPAKRYYFAWYDQLGAGVLDWLLMSNGADGAGAARISAQVGAITYQDLDLAAGAPVATPMFPGVRGGPVIVNTTSPLLVSQRIHWKKSLEEVVGIDAERLSAHYYWSWYDDLVTPGMLNWILIANPDANNSVSYQIKLGSQTISCDAAHPCLGAPPTGVIGPGGTVTARFSGRRGGPVEVIASGPVVASQRVHMNFDSPDEAFNEAVGVPEDELSSHYWWTWYDDLVTPGMLNWILIANPNGFDVDYQIKIGGEAKGWGTIRAAGGRDAQGKALDIVFPRFAGVQGGPVEVKASRSGSTTPANVIASQRVHLGSSFGEVAGYRQEALGGEYHWTWYDDLVTPGLLNWILIANPNGYDVKYEIRVAGQLKASQVLKKAGSKDAQGQAADIAFPRFPGLQGGPVEVKATREGSTLPANVIASQRVHLSGYINEVAGTVLN